MKSEIDVKYEQELSLSLTSRDSGNFDKEWKHLERAHILAQFFAIRHFYVHILMIRFSLVHFKGYEILGQIPRIILAIPGSLTGLAPKGNSGGSNVGIFTPMEIPDDLKKAFEHSKKKHESEIDS